MSNPFTDNIVVLAPTAVTVSNLLTPIQPVDVSKRAIKSIQFTAASVTSGNGAFGLEVSNDGTNWIVYNRLIDNVTNTNAQTDTHVAAPTLSSNTSKIYFFPTSDYFRYLRVFVTRTTDGTYSAVLQSA